LTNALNVRKSHVSLNQRAQNRERDKRVLELLRTDWEAGFEALFKEYYAEVCQHMYRLWPDQQAVEDIAQDMFMEIWNKRGTLQIDTSPGAYLYRMARSRALNYIRDNRKHLYDDDSRLSDRSAEMISPVQKLHVDQL
jgi:RNA polymerase sigma-70 factor (ECF subfamily)